jgi:hypothetical protein
MYRRRVRECQRADGEGADRIDEVKATAKASLHSFVFAAGAAGGAGRRGVRSSAANAP